MDEADEPEFNISRILRNTLVNSIWEGTTNILASELVRFLLKRDHLPIFKGWLERSISLIRTQALSSALKKAWSSLLARLQKNASPHLLLADSRRVMFTLSWILSGTLLALDAERDGDGVAMEIARRWILLGEGGVGEFVYRDIVNASEDSSSSEDHVRWDCRIAWGVELPDRQVTGHRSLRSSKL